MNSDERREIPERITLEELTARMNSVPGGKNFLARMRARSFDEFVEVLYDDLDEVIKSMEANPQRHEPEDEDRLTYFIATMLKQRQYRARQGEMRGGSVDLTVEGYREDFVWTAEAKIYRSIADPREGFLQLHTRYSPADLEHHKAGLLLYVKRSGSAALMQQWRDELSAMGLDALTIDDCARRPHLSFVSTHASRRSGLPASTRHMSVSVFHDPLDKSGRSAQKHIAAREENKSSQ